MCVFKVAATSYQQGFRKERQGSQLDCPNIFLQWKQFPVFIANIHPSWSSRSWKRKEKATDDALDIHGILKTCNKMALHVGHTQSLCGAKEGMTSYEWLMYKVLNVQIIMTPRSWMRFHLVTAHQSNAKNGDLKVQTLPIVSALEDMTFNRNLHL